MPRVTLDIDAAVWAEIRALQKAEGRSLGKLISELLSEALERHRQLPETPLTWLSQPMYALADLHDKDAVYVILDGDCRE